MKRKCIVKIHRNKLESAIQYVVENKEKYTQNPGVDFTRDRKLPMATTIKLLLQMEGGSLKKELHDYSMVTNSNVSSSAFVQRRNKISEKAFYDIFRYYNKCCYDNKTVKGYHVYAADGSDIPMPRNPKSDTFLCTKWDSTGHNQIHLNALYDLCNRTYTDALLQTPHKVNEGAALITMLKRNAFKGKSIIIMDRGYEGFNLFAHLIETDAVDFVCRVKNGAGGFAEIQRLPMQELDVDIHVEISTTQTNEDKRNKRHFIQTGSKKGKINSKKTAIHSWDFQSPYAMNWRVVRFMLNTGDYETIVTSLPRNVFSIAEIKELYHMRWGIETSFRKLKYFIGLVNLHGKSNKFAAQEIYAALTMYNFCERVAHTVIVCNSTNKVHVYALNYAMAFHLCRCYYKWNNMSGDKLIEDIGRYIEPIRPGRKDKRKLRNKAFAGFLYRVAA